MKEYSASVFPDICCCYLGTHSLLKDNEVALSTVVGIIDGTGALGAAIGQLLVRILSDTYGWPSVFIWLCVATCSSATLLLPLTVDVTRAVLARRRHRRNNAENTPHLISRLICSLRQRQPMWNVVMLCVCEMCMFIYVRHSEYDTHVYTYWLDHLTHTYTILFPPPCNSINFLISIVTSRVT